MGNNHQRNSSIRTTLSQMFSNGLKGYGAKQLNVFAAVISSPNATLAKWSYAIHSEKCHHQQYRCQSSGAYFQAKIRTPPPTRYKRDNGGTLSPNTCKMD